MLDKINSAIIATRTEIVEREKRGSYIEAVEHLDDLMALVKLRNAYNEARDRGLI